jgi:hypothetical protein
MERISQSIFKDFAVYQLRESCGLQFRAKYIDKTWKDQQSDVQAAGWWFEDMLIRGRSDKQMKTIKSGEPNALYRYLQAHIEVGQRMLNAVTINFSNRVVNNGNITGTPDAICKDRIIDIKTSAHLNNKYDSYGWGALDNPESRYYAAQVSDKRIQALTYLYLADGLTPIQEKVRVVEFWVFANNSDDARVFRFTFTDQEVSDWATTMLDALDAINYELVVGFDAVPSYERCKGCQLAESCKSARRLPDVINV